MKSAHLALFLPIVVAGCGSSPSSGGGSGDDTIEPGSGGSVGGSDSTSTGGSGFMSTAGMAGTTSTLAGSGGSASTSAGAGGSSGGAPIGHGGGGGNAVQPASDGGAMSVTALGCPTSQEPGTWKNVTPSTMKMTGDFTDGPLTVGVDPVKPSNIYIHAQHDGTWKSTDCGMTYTKVSTGLNADKQNTGSQWGSVIDPNPSRDPNTPPTLFVNQGYGALSLWKSTDGGVSWADVFKGNVYRADGTNISQDVGNDLAAPSCLSTMDASHLLVFLHSYWGKGGNDGIFETTDGGGKWTLHATPGFNFQPHSDLLSAIDEKTWWVSHGNEFWRTTDAGATWNKSSGDASPGMGHSIAQAGSVYYTGSDFHDGVFKSTDRGASWKRTAAPGNQIGWIAATRKNVYGSNGYVIAPHILRASLSNDAVWTDEGNPAGMTVNGANNPGVIFDGEHSVIIAADANAGAWRYVEP